MPVPYTFGTATAAIPLSQLDSNFSTAVTIGNTAVQLGNTVTTLNNLTLANVTISSGNVTITNVSVTTANVSGTANVSSLVVLTNETVLGNTAVTGNVTASINVTGAKLIPTGTSVTGNGLYLPAANALGLSTNGTNAVYIDSSQNVGIGTASPSSILNVKSSAPIFRLETTGTVTSTGTAYNVIRDSTGSDVFVNGFAGLANCYQFATTFSNGFMRFMTGAQAEAMRIDSSGNLLVGKTTTAYGTSGIRLSNGVSQTGAEFTSSQLPVAINLLAATGNSVVFSWNTVDKGYINYNGTLVAISQISDQRLKENIVDAPSALEKVNSIKIRSFNFKENNQYINYGVIAQELNEVVPAAVFHGVDDEDGNIKSPWAVGLEPLIPILTKAIQEQQSLIQSLTTRITALEAK